MPLAGDAIPLAHVVDLRTKDRRGGRAVTIERKVAEGDLVVVAHVKHASRAEIRSKAVEIHRCFSRIQAFVSNPNRERSPPRQIKEEPRSSGEEETVWDHREKKSPRKSSDKSPEPSRSLESDSDDSCDSWKHKMRSTVSVVKR